MGEERARVGRQQRTGGGRWNRGRSDGGQSETSKGARPERARHDRTGGARRDRPEAAGRGPGRSHDGVLRAAGAALTRPWRTALLLGLAGVLLAGCASMPDSGDLRGVEASQRPDSQVRVFAMPPRENDGPNEVLQGFLEALTSDDPQFEIARKYLTKDASKKWHPERSTTVLADGPNVEAITDHSSYGAEDGRQFALKGHRLAVVDAQHAYQPSNGDFSESVHLSHEVTGGHREWRIDDPPTGIVLGASDFQRIYQPVDTYYYAASSRSSSSEAGPVNDFTGTQGALVADPIYVRQRVDPVTQTLRALLAGPTKWLDPVVQTGFPAGTRLKAGAKGLEPDDQNTLKVPLNAKADRVGPNRCERMAAQVVFTLQDVTSTGGVQVTLLRSDGSTLCELSADGAEAVAPRRSAGDAAYQYFLDSEHRLMRMATAGGDPRPVPGPFGNGAKELGRVAVSRDEDRAAGVSLDGRQLYVTDLDTHGSLGDAVLHSRADDKDDRLTAPSWDGHGNLWIADRDPDRPHLLVLDHGTGDPVEVSTPRLDPGRIEAVRVAADGVRIALLVDRDGKESLYVGRIERQGGTGDSAVKVAGLRPGAPQMEQVTAMSWAGGSRLVVVGRESGGVQQVRYVQCDGSAPASGVLPGLTGVTEIAASDDERLPLVALSADGIVRMPPGAPWQTVGKSGADGTSPVYPG